MPVEVQVPVPVPQEKIVEVPFAVEKIKRVKLVPQPEEDCEPAEKQASIDLGLGLLPQFDNYKPFKGKKPLKKLLKHKLKKLL